MLTATETDTTGRARNNQRSRVWCSHSPFHCDANKLDNCDVITLSESLADTLGIWLAVSTCS